jgi:hypothetical protein
MRDLSSAASAALGVVQIEAHAINSKRGDHRQGEKHACGRHEQRRDFWRDTILCAGFSPDLVVDSSDRALSISFVLYDTKFSNPNGAGHYLNGSRTEVTETNFSDARAPRGTSDKALLRCNKISRISGIYRRCANLVTSSPSIRPGLKNVATSIQSLWGWCRN